MNRAGVSTLCALAMICASATASGPSQPAKRRGPSPYSTPELTKRRAIGAPIAADGWTTPRAGASRGALQFDNGAPLDDFRDPASQLSEMPPDPLYEFIAAAADDFIFVDAMDPLGSVAITNVRVAFTFFDDGGETATPTTTWTNGVFVTIYPNDPMNKPAGQPDNMGGQTGAIAHVLVPVSALLNETPGGVCRPYYQVDIPLSVPIVVQKNLRYWLSIVPRYPAPPQAAWCHSQINRDNIAKNGFVTDMPVIPFWTDIPGNFGEVTCPDPQPAGTLRNLAFVLDAEEAATNPGACCDRTDGTCADVMNPSDCTGEFEEFTAGATCAGITCTAITGACCDDSAVTCSDGVMLANCLLPNRFEADVLCADLAPPCGTTDPGACCLPNGPCSDLTPVDCSQQNGVWNAGDCSTFFCPPLNDACASAISVTDGTYNVVTLGASTDGPVEACSNVENDVWFAYTAVCDGTLTVNLCTADFNSAVAVYNGCAPCPADPNTALVCNDDACGTASYVTVPVTTDNCYLVRVGGSAGASGIGQMVLTCTPSGFGACCHSDQSCSYPVALVDCMAGGDVYNDGQPCSIVTCPPLGACCVPESPCQILTQSACEGGGGTYQGDATTCMPDPCPVLGACCFPGGGCQELDSVACAAQSGTYHGDGSSCTPNPCPSGDPSACCKGDITNNCGVEMADVPAFVNALLEVENLSPEEVCRADVNADTFVDGLDIGPFIDRLINNPTCSVTSCCPGDTNIDGFLNGLDAQGMVNALLAPPFCGSDAFCRVDVDSDGAFSMADVEAFVNLLMTDATCLP